MYPENVFLQLRREGPQRADESSEKYRSIRKRAHLHQFYHAFFDGVEVQNFQGAWLYPNAILIAKKLHIERKMHKCPFSERLPITHFSPFLLVIHT